MGSASSEEKKDQEIIAGNMGIKDISYISSVIQVLYNLPLLKNYFLQNNYQQSPNKPLGILMHEILSTELSEIKFDEISKNILSCLRRNYGLSNGNTPGDILIQILLVLKYEDKEIKQENWEKVVMNNQQLFNNIRDEKQALDDILEKNMAHFNTTFSGMFFGLFLAKRKFMDINSILYFYNFYCVYELNMPRIYHNMIYKGKVNNNQEQLPKLNLIDCIKEMQETHTDIFNKKNCFVEYYMFNAPNYLIFLIKKDELEFESFRGNILFGEIMDFSPVIQNTQTNRFKLVSIIDQKKYNEKAKEKDNKGVSWFFSSDDEDKSEYKATFRDENDKFSYYKNGNSIKNCELNIEDLDYYHHILIFMRCEN